MKSNASRLDENDVMNIWHLTIELSDKILAEKYEVHKSTIANIFRSKPSWPDVDPGDEIRNAAMAARIARHPKHIDPKVSHDKRQNRPDRNQQ